jgi:hypothetical protein
MAHLETYPAHIANGQTTSSDGSGGGGLVIDGNGLITALIPAAFTGTAISFQVSLDDTTYYPLYNADGTLYSVTVATSHAVALDPSTFVAVAFVKVVSNASEGGARVVTLVGRAL